MPQSREKSYYEIQLDHKQLIVVFFAVVAICVVMFLLGVMVGKGRAVSALDVAAVQAKAPIQEKEPEALGEGKQSRASVAVPSPGANRTPEAKKTAVLEKAGTEPKETLSKAPAAKPVSAATPTAPAREASQATPTPAVGALDISALPLNIKEGYSIHIQSYVDRKEAQDMRGKLKEAGYPAYVDSKVISDKGRTYSVRVGKFVNEADALKVKAKLEKEQNLKKLWIIRK
jgi:cell division septation protein DedD